MASGDPEASTVNWPSRARAVPPLIGASTNSRPAPATARPIARARSGAMVAQDRMTAPGALRATAPSGPSSTASVWSALTTTVTTACAPSAASAAEA